MKVILDSTAIIHHYKNFGKLNNLLNQHNVSSFCTTKINYLEILAGAENNAKVEIRKMLNLFELLHFESKAIAVADKLAMQNVVNKKNRKDFLIAAIAIANNLPLVTQNDLDFHFPKLKVLTYDKNFNVIRKIFN